MDVVAVEKERKYRGTKHAPHNIDAMKRNHFAIESILISIRRMCRTMKMVVKTGS